MRIFRLIDETGVTAEGFQASDGRFVALPVRVRMHAVVYASREKMQADWRTAVLEWIDVPEAE